MESHTNPWKILNEKEIYDNPWINLKEYDVINPGGGKGIYGKVHFKNLAIGIVAINDVNEIALIGQYRFPIDQYSWEIPEGGGLHGIDPLVSAQRELQEETGLLANNWEKLLEMHLSNSVSDELGIIYLATDLKQTTANPEETEELDFKWLPFDDVLQQVMQNKITDSLTVAAILKLKLKHLGF
jgi:8-oxo-dGTP pyrophosphatase MutT (NUDIX family)